MEFFAEAIAGETLDMGDLHVPARRLAAGEQAGELGFTLMPYTPGRNVSLHRVIVASVTPSSPADIAGLKVGNTITAIDGYDLTGAHYVRFPALTQVAPGIQLTILTAGGSTLRLVVGSR